MTRSTRYASVSCCWLSQASTNLIGVTSSEMSIGTCPSWRELPMSPCHASLSRILIRTLSPPDDPTSTYRKRDYNVTTTPGQSTRSLISSGSISAAHGQVKPDEP